MDIYIAICLDRHIDEDIKVFTDPWSAIEYVRDFIPNRYEIKEQELTEEMRREGWLYLANYGTESDSVRVEIGQLEINDE